MREWSGRQQVTCPLCTHIYSMPATRRAPIEAWGSSDEQHTVLGAAPRIWAAWGEWLRR